MIRFPILAAILLCSVTASTRAAELATPAATDAVVATPAPDAARMLALEIAARAQNNSVRGGHYNPMPPRPPAFTAPVAQQPAAASGAVPASNGCGNGAIPSGTPAGIAAAANGGARFLPLRRDTAPRAFNMPARQQTVVTAQALRAAVAGSQNESDLAQTALQTASQPSAHNQALAEIANIGAPGGGAGTAPSTDPTAIANQAVMREIKLYRQAHGKW